MAKSNRQRRQRHGNGENCLICTNYMQALLKLVHHKYCLGGASYDEIIAAMMDACENTLANLAGELSEDTDVPTLR